MLTGESEFGPGFEVSERDNYINTEMVEGFSREEIQEWGNRRKALEREKVLAHIEETG